MPKLPLNNLDCVCYLYKTEEDAQSGFSCGGTGFFVSVPSETSEERVFIHAVTNWHVALRDACPVIRVNTNEQTPHVIPFTSEDWIASLDGDDVVVSKPVWLDLAKQRVRAVPWSMFVDRDKNRGPSVGIGDGVFMLGRFMDLDSGAPTNVPVARFGHISSMPYAVVQPTSEVRPTYCVDVHSRSGFSGSPVFAYRTFGTDLDELFRTKVLDPNNAFTLLLGVHCDQFPEVWEIASSTTRAAVKGLSGMTKVVPSASISDLLMRPELIAARRALD